MEQNDNISLFEVDENTGEIIYTPGEENFDAGDVTVPTDEVGDMVLDPESVPEDDLEIEEEAPGVDFLDSGSDGVPVVLSEEVTAAILAASPAGGSIGSSTLDYFDRVVSGLPADYKYIAYRTSTDDSYDAVLYYSNDFDISGNVIMFDDCVQLEVERVNSSNYNTETIYTSAEVSDTSVVFSQSGSVLYYTNAVEGYPVLGGFNPQKGVDFYLIPALISALAIVIMSKLVFRR